MSTRRSRNQAKAAGSFVRGAAQGSVKCPPGQYHYGNMFGEGCTVARFDRRHLGCGGYAANRESMPAGCDQSYDGWGNMSGSGSWSRGRSQSGSWDGRRSGSGLWSGSQSGSLSRSRSRSRSRSYDGSSHGYSGSYDGSVSPGSWQSAYPSGWSSHQYVHHMTRGLSYGQGQRRYRYRRS